MSDARFMTLGALLQPLSIPVSPADQAKVISKITSDSREVTPGSLFVAVKGSSSDGHDHLWAAVQAGAVAVVIEETPKDPGSELGAVPCFEVRDSKKMLGEIAAAFEGNPSGKIKLIGVTGTSGKTTTTYMCEAILQAAGEKVGVIGTVNFRYGDQVLPSTHTTPGAPELQRVLRQMVDAGCTAVVMEVSSHALKQQRVAGCAFDVVIFGNLSRDHLDFHPDMEDYYQSKRLLFTDAIRDSLAKGKTPKAVINPADEWGARLIQETFLPAEHLRRCGVLEEHKLQLGLGGIEFHCKSDGANFVVRSPLLGHFNATNLLAAVQMGLLLRVPVLSIQEGLAQLKTIPGRLERVADLRHEVLVLVDYAHKPDALDKVLEMLRSLVAQQQGKGRIITVFGCGGDRDRGKRPLMGALAARWSDGIVLTSDNPRTEDPLRILEEIQAGIPVDFRNDPEHFVCEPDRAVAIQRAILNASPGDVVLIAGKGHEDYQIIRDPQSDDPKKVIKVPFDDRKIANLALSRRHNG
jgi:UDP-N-acetylmuramoyl-L-alanyl-D-glutamate--2,6-diaminopimelate ligase